MLDRPGQAVRPDAGHWDKISGLTSQDAQLWDVRDRRAGAKGRVLDIKADGFVKDGESSCVIVLDDPSVDHRPLRPVGSSGAERGTWQGENNTAEPWRNCSKS